MKQGYSSDVNDERWVEIGPLVQAKTGRKARVDRRLIVNAILYVMHTGCQWRELPHDFPNWSTVYSCYHRWSWNGTLDKIHAVLRQKVRQKAGKAPYPTAGSVDSQSVKCVAKGGSRACCNGAMTALSV